MPCLILTLEWEIGKDIYLWRFADWNLCFLFRNATLRWSPLQYALSLRHRFPLITCGSLSNLVINFLSWLIMSWLSWCMFCKFSLFSLLITVALQNVGFIGLGNMGSRMANNLIKAGFRLTVHDLYCFKHFLDLIMLFFFSSS